MSSLYLDFSLKVSQWLWVLYLVLPIHKWADIFKKGESAMGPLHSAEMAHWVLEFKIVGENWHDFPIQMKNFIHPYSILLSSIQNYLVLGTIR